MRRLLRHALAAGYLAGLRRASRVFARALADPAAAQRETLFATLRANADTAYGRLHRFSRIDSVARFQEEVPIVDYDALAPWIARVEEGERRVLTAASVRAFERSGGSSGRTKLIPYTDPLLAEINASTGPWIRDVLMHQPGVRGGAWYWAISPVAQAARSTKGGIPIGFEDDSEYFGPVSRWALRHLQAVPPSVARIPDVAAWRSETARLLSAERDLTLISVWSPTFLTMLMRAVGRRGDQLWPRLALISCWTEGSSSAFLPELKEHFPATPIQGKGLLATEGVVSIPLVGLPAPVAAVAGHFLEFIDLAQPAARPRLVHELKVGERYSPLLTTGGGLTRYRLNDIVECVGWHQRAPLLRFEGRLDGVADLCGEKVSPKQAEQAVRIALQHLRPDFVLLTPALTPTPHYRLYLEGSASMAQLDSIAAAVDGALSASHPYRYCRDLGQLGPVRVVPVKNGRAEYERAILSRGQRLGNVKPTLFDPRPTKIPEIVQD